MVLSFRKQFFYERLSCYMFIANTNSWFQTLICYVFHLLFHSNSFRFLCKSTLLWKFKEYDNNCSKEDLADCNGFRQNLFLLELLDNWLKFFIFFPSGLRILVQLGIDRHGRASVRNSQRKMSKIVPKHDFCQNKLSVAC